MTREDLAMSENATDESRLAVGWMQSFQTIDSIARMGLQHNAPGGWEIAPGVAGSPRLHPSGVVVWWVRPVVSP